VVLAVDGFRESVEGGEGQSAGILLLQLHRSRMERGMPRVRAEKYVAELRIRSVVLRLRERGRPQCRIICAEVNREGVGLPSLDQSHAGRSLVDEFQNVRSRQLMLDAHIPVE